MMRKKKTDPKFYKRRRMLTAAFLGSEFFKLVLEPHILAEIRDCDSLNGMDENDIEKSYFKKKNKKSMYQGLLSKLKAWSTKNYKDEEV